MTFPHDDLQALADRMQCGQAPHRVRETLEASLIPVVRRALRTGAGMPPLVRWVRATLPRVDAGGNPDRPVDPDRAAPVLARLLCATLLRGRPAERPAAAETVAVA